MGKWACAHGAGELRRGLSSAVPHSSNWRSGRPGSLPAARAGRWPSHVPAGRLSALGGPLGHRHPQAEASCAAPIVHRALPGVRALCAALRRVLALLLCPAMALTACGMSDGNGSGAAEALISRPPAGVARRRRRRKPYLTHCLSILPAEASTSPRVLNLNGSDWRFQLFDRPEAVPAGFGGASFDASSWPQVGVGRGTTRGCEHHARHRLECAQPVLHSHGVTWHAAWQHAELGIAVHGCAHEADSCPLPLAHSCPPTQLPTTAHACPCHADAYALTCYTRNTTLHSYRLTAPCLLPARSRHPRR